MNELVIRPWGSYQVLDQGVGYQVKRIVVNSDAQLSLQYHKYRSETWVVVSGKASVRRGDDLWFLVDQGNSVFIAVGTPHRLSNRGPALLIVIEAQHGLYLGEDDIVRLEDDYGRV